MDQLRVSFQKEEGEVSNSHLEGQNDYTQGGGPE